MNTLVPVCFICIKGSPFGSKLGLGPHWFLTGTSYQPATLFYTQQQVEGCVAASKLCSCAVVLNILLFAFSAGCRLHSEHTTDQRRCSGAGTARAEPPSAAAAGHERLPGTSRPHSESLTSAPTLLMYQGYKECYSCLVG